jgi:hypothetical protein
VGWEQTGGLQAKSMVPRLWVHEQTVGFCGQKAGCQGCGFVSRLEGFVGKEQGAKVAGL